MAGSAQQSYNVTILGELTENLSLFYLFDKKNETGTFVYTRFHEETVFVVVAAVVVCVCFFVTLYALQRQTAVSG